MTAARGTMPTAGVAAAKAAARSRRLIVFSIAAAVATLVTLAAGAGLLLSHKRQAALDVARLDAGHLARQVASEAATLALLADMAAVDINRLVYRDAADIQGLQIDLDTRATLLPGLHGGAAYDARGGLIAASKRYPAEPPAWLETLLVAHRDAWQDMLLVPVVEAPEAGSGLLAVSRSLWGDGRAFEGFAVMLVDLGRLRDWVADQPAARDGAVDLLLSDGIPLARLSGAGEPRRLDPESVRHYRAAASDTEAGVPAPSARDDLIRVAGLARDMPLVATVSLDPARLLASWRDLRDAVLAGGGVIAAVVFVLLAAFVRGERRRTRAEAALRVSEERLTAALENGNLGLWDWNVETGEVHLGARLLVMLGYGPDELPHTTETYKRLVHPDDLPAVGAALHAHAAGETDVYATEHRLLARDGGVLWVADRGRAVGRDAAGRATRIIGIQADITPLKQVQEALQEKSLALETSNRDLEQFAYIASHDLQEPLRMVSSYLTLLERREAAHLTDQGREYIAFAVDGAKRMTRLIRDLLEYSRVGTRGTAPEPLDTGAVIAEAVQNLRLAAADANAGITIDENAPPVFGDRGQIVRLVQNLVGNAIKYRAPDRVPRIAVEARRVPEQGLVALSVSDNGIGIEERDRERVFQIFQRVHGQGSAYDGTGIGLAVCRRIAERHGGHIAVASVPGKGTTFTVTLPAATAGHAAVGKESLPHPA